MNTSRSIPRKLALALSFVVSLLAMVGAPSRALAAPVSKTSTGQGIMVTLAASGSFAVQQANTYKYNENTAATYFINAWDGTVTYDGCTGPGCSVPPTAPAAPAPLASEVTGPSGAVAQNQCNFLDGAPLAGHSYTQSVKVSTGSGKTGATYTYTYTYNVTPTAAQTAPFTAWDLVNTSGTGLANIVINGWIAGESALSSSKTSIKYSFSLTTTDPTTGLQVSRVQNVVLTVDGVPYAIDAPVSYPVDFDYVTNAGSNGSTSLLKNGNARTILNNDSFTGNNDGGADGSALALAHLQAAFGFAPGDHTVTLTGTIKGNSATADLGFSVTQVVHVITPGCSGN